MEIFSGLVARCNDILWGQILIYLLLGAGIYFTIGTRTIQIRRFRHHWTLMLSSRSGAGSGISSFQAFCVGLASRVGTGNIAGVAIAITLGGPGAIFWMWCVGFLGMATAFIESTLAQIFKVQQPDGTFRGGPAFYIERGLGVRWLGTAFSLLLVFSFGTAFNAVQSNAIAEVLGKAHDVEVHITGIGLVLLAIPAFFGGVKRIARIAEWLLPLMAFAYIGMAIVIIFLHIEKVPEVLAMIISSAFGLKQASAGLAGGIMAAILNGVKRGLFSNEAGMGSSPNAAATATTTHPAIQGFIQSLGVFVDTIIICTATAFIILISGLYDPAGVNSISGSALTQAVVTHQFGAPGQIFMTLVVFLFAFSSILGNYSYAEGNLTFLKVSSSNINLFRIISLTSILAGTFAELPLVWALADIAMGLMAAINLITILLLSKWAFGALKDYEDISNGCSQPVFISKGNKNLPGNLQDSVW